MGFELDTRSIADRLGDIRLPHAETVTSEKTEIPTPTKKDVIPNYGSTRNWNMPSRRTVVLAAGAFAVAAGAWVATDYNKAPAPVVEPKAESPLIIPENPLPTYSPNNETPTDTQLLPQDTIEPEIRDFVIGSISLGAKGKDCKPDVKGYVQAASIPLTINGHSHVVKTPKIDFSFYSCGTEIGAFVENTGKTTTEPVTYTKQVRVNRDDINFSLTTDKITPKISNILPAQILQNKGYKGAADICTAFPETIGCKGVKVPKEFLLTSSQENFIMNSMPILVLNAIKTACASKAEGIYKQKIAQLHDGQAKGQLVDGSLVSERYVDSASNDVTTNPDFTKNLISPFVKKGGSDDPEKLKEMFGDSVRLTAVCTVNPINISEG